MNKTLLNCFDPTVTPKRILSLDGGGIRGALTLGYLKKIETILREKQKNDKLVLSDYFDLIGGTSTGSIIAAALSLGKTVDEIKKLYMTLGGEIFKGKRHLWNPFQTWSFFKARYNHIHLENNLRNLFKDLTLGSSDIRTGLCIVAKRADTNSVWPLINHPKGTFYNDNKNILLWQAVKASCAAPTFFIPQMIDVGKSEYAAFVDGGVSMANNPALILLLIATLKGFPFQWEMGEDKLLLVSVGTGYKVFKKHVGKIKRAWLKNWALEVPEMLMQDASWQNQIMLQWLSNSPTATEIDIEMRDLKLDYIGGTPLISYLRYNFAITENCLNGLKLGQDFTEKKVNKLAEMSNADNRELLYTIGEKASENINPAHFF